MAALVSLLLIATDATGLTIIPPSCETPSLGMTTYRSSFSDDGFVVFEDWAPESVNDLEFVRLVDCSSGSSLSVMNMQLAFAEVGGSQTHRSGPATVKIMDGAIKSDDIYTLRSVRDLVRAKGGDGLLVSIPNDYCGCDIVSKNEAGATQ